MSPESTLETRRSGFVEGLLVDEPFDVILGYLVTAHELLDLLVRLIHTRQSCKLAGAHGGLDRLAEHLQLESSSAWMATSFGWMEFRPPIRLFNASSE